MVIVNRVIIGLVLLCALAFASYMLSTKQGRKIVFVVLLFLLLSYCVGTMFDWCFGLNHSHQ